MENEKEEGRENTKAVNMNNPINNLMNYSTPASCKAAGCTLTHITLKEIVLKLGRKDLWQGARKGRNIRAPIRKHARTGKLKKLGRYTWSVGVLLQGTKIVRTQAEIAAGTTSQRTHWYWHLGDPDIAVVKSIIRSTVPLA